jgi:hypothetical protein
LTNSNPFPFVIAFKKIISKIMARRLKVNLFNHISSEQFGFLEGRQIHEVVGIAQEGSHSIKIKKIKEMGVKVDHSKAYERAHSLYLSLMLIHLGFNA